MISVVRRPLLGPLVCGLVLGGVPIGTAFSILGRLILGSTSVTSDCATWALALFAVPVTFVGAILGATKAWHHLLRRAVLTSFAACVPIPATVDMILLSKWGYEVFALQNFWLFMILLLFWWGGAAVSAWVLALTYSRLRPSSDQPRGSLNTVRQID
jgi:hypothetical protein